MNVGRKTALAATVYYVSVGWQSVATVALIGAR